MLGFRRSRIQIAHDVIVAAPATMGELLSLTGLNHDTLAKYLSFLTSRGLLEKVQKINLATVYHPTTKGEELVAEIEAVAGMLVG
jgi:predicted transcriptional regulator